MTLTKFETFRWAIAGFGKVAAGGHHHGIVRNNQTLAGFTTRDGRSRLGDASHIDFNWGTKGLTFDNAGMSICNTCDKGWLKELNGRVDAVIVCVPTPDHLEVVRRVLNAGFDCLVEKPLAMNAAEGKKLLETARRKKRKLLVAQVLPAIKEFALLLQTIQERKLKNLAELRLHRFVPWQSVVDQDPKAVNEGYFADLGIHDLHFISCLGQVLGFRCDDMEMEHGKLQRAHVITKMQGCSDTLVSTHVGASQGVDGFSHGFTAAWRDGSTLKFENGVLTDGNGPVELPAQSTADVFGDELNLAARHFALGEDPGYLNAKAALAALQHIDTVTALVPV